MLINLLPSIGAILVIWGGTWYLWDHNAKPPIYLLLGAGACLGIAILTGVT